MLLTGRDSFRRTQSWTSDLVRAKGIDEQLEVPVVELLCPRIPGSHRVEALKGT